MIFPFNPPDETDSEDLTDLEIANAILTSGEADIVRGFKERLCPSCGLSIRLIKQARRRRSPHLYWRMHFTCSEGHVNSMLFRTDWMKG